ncbi:sensor histidine kinase [Actinokineospora cianjurensis]|uniref:Two-component system LytT family sensor kinase n=1 Tax=Actinokineospora cianjurensis TaxID=585224 RepID=A0A421AW58_9PSEU|nr:histidine kinase [Actinokineospora cianjurensis]RLK53862.1 two-component system LytT family sensor kinase [Actinokineospora cianjurensis]
MSEDDEPVRPRARLPFVRRPPVDPAAVLAVARRVTEDLAEGLTGAGVASAARGLRGLLGADAVGLADLSGRSTWAGPVPGGTRWAALVDEVMHSEARAGRPPLVVLPLHVHDELAGTLLIAGKVPARATREATEVVVAALSRARLEASAEHAARAELRALRAEISPHFVYNALTVIAALVHSDPERSHELMLDFADYNRYSLARHGEYTTVAEEFHAIETYLALQRAVLGERLRVQVRVAPEVLAVAIPYLVLQPLVENAVRHGVEPRATGGLVQVRGEAEGGDCVITVDDDGVGMAPAHAEAILAGRGPEGSVGLSNVDRRLRTVYGSWYGLVVETERDAGTKVVVRMPMFAPGVVVP